jgi:hypothetical protein
VSLRARDRSCLDPNQEVGAAAGEAGGVGWVAVAEAEDPARDLECASLLLTSSIDFHSIQSVSCSIAAAPATA